MPQAMREVCEASAAIYVVREKREDLDKSIEAAATLAEAIGSRNAGN